VTGNPIAFHAMRGLARIQTAFNHSRAGGADVLLDYSTRPGGFRTSRRSRAPCRRRQNRLTVRIGAAQHAARQRSARLAGRAEICSSRRRQAFRIDKAFSWEYPLAVHGLMHGVITNAWRGDPYPIVR